MKYYLSLFVVLLCFISCKKKAKEVVYHKTTVKLLSKKKDFVAGDSISLVFEFSGSKVPKLSITNNYGILIIPPLLQNGKLIFDFPFHVKQQSGCCYWVLLSENAELDAGEIHINPRQEVDPNLEAYLGPRNIVAGTSDFSMLVVCPTDSFDNPMLDQTPVKIKTYYGNQLTDGLAKSIDFVAKKKIYSYKRQGKIAVTSSCFNTQSKELSIDVFPVLPIDFAINFKRNHNYADGNQLVEFSSSSIKDKYNNTVSDGTSVTFIVIDDGGNVLTASGLTIGGIVRVSLLHPSSTTNWKVTAYVFGAAQSNTLKLDFKAAVEDYPISYFADERTFRIGPIKSYMQQLIPDGLLIILKIYNQENKLVQQYATTSNSGYGEFDISTLYLIKGKYTARIKALGIEKNIQFSIYD